ncbi:leishmanolysin-2 (M08 family) [Schistosoma japonicum]|nr:leishmanolysin-2 (M08 family) [Schistosoma japonicum]KAH8871143.1 leishmanolysin-2 (M08 family) [Schistosoma japonicum]KAH8871147.1 leishmanolysin-2 (M08 family) [Schistosoma japonicum]
MTETPYRRKRALSFAGFSELPKLSNNVQFGQLPTTSRIRHPSFIRSDGYPTLNEVLEGVSSKLNNTESEFLLCKDSTDVKEFLRDKCDLYPRKSSVSTVVDHPLYNCISSPEIFNKPPSSCSDSLSKLSKPSNSTAFSFSDYLVPDSPLSSNLVKLYLAKIAASKPARFISPINSLESKPPQTSAQVDLHCLPECLQIHLPTLASMVMPVNQVSRVCSSRNKSEHISSMEKSDDLVNSLNTYLNGRNALTDASYSSGVSDTESWSHPPTYAPTNTGYLSDNHLMDATFEAKKLSMSKRQLEMRLNLRTGFNGTSPCRTPRNSSDNLNHKYLTPKFEFTHVYDGLIPPNVFLSTNRSFTNLLGISQSHGNFADDDYRGRKLSTCYSMPGSPHINSKNPHLQLSNSSELNSTFHRIADDNNNGGTGRFERLRALLGNFKKDNVINTQEDDHYFYMDEKSLENRIKCQASNVILPVSF